MLKTINKEKNSNTQQRVSEANTLLQAVQVLALENPSEESFQEERDMLQRWVILRSIEESYFCQKSRVNWLQKGDQNTTYFFRKFQTIMSYNLIRSFQLPSGDFITDPKAMGNHAVNHFMSILGPTEPPLLEIHLPWNGSKL